MMPIKLLVVDDHPLMREAIRTAVAEEADLLVIGEAADGREGLNLALNLQPDVIIMDLLMPGMDGLEAIAQFRTLDLPAKILVVTSMNNEERVLAAIQAGALGYFSKTSSRATLLAAIRQVANGLPYLPPDIALKLMSILRKSSASIVTPPPIEPLTGRQQEIVALLAEGRTDAEIGQTLHLTEATVRSHVHHILQRLELETRAQLIAYAHQHAKSA